MGAEEAQHRNLPLPEGWDWEQISYVVGGYATKVLYLDQLGYIITNTLDRDGEPVAGNNQYNLLTREWSDFFPGEQKSYDCGSCHSTGFLPRDTTPGKPGIVGSWVFPGVECEHCHGPGSTMAVDQSAEACGECHKHPDTDGIEAVGGFIRSEGQYSEYKAGPHAGFACVSCHNPHENAEDSIKVECESCHGGVAQSYADTIMAKVGVACEDCHMPYATLSAQPLGPSQGDRRTHIFYIDTDPGAELFTADGDFVQLDDDGKAAVTLDFACQRCHAGAELDELAKFASGFHESDGSLENFGLDPGLTGTWWDADRSGEGFLLEVGEAGGSTVLFASFYTYDAAGNQTWLTAQLTSADGTTANVDVFMPEGGQWGDDFDPDDVSATPWGSGVFSFPACGSGTVMLTPNAAMQAIGFTEVSFELTRTLEPGVACPTFANNTR
jgi:hypothetical protein